MQKHSVSTADQPLYSLGMEATGRESVALVARTDQGSIQAVTKGDKDMRTDRQFYYQRTSVLTQRSVSLKEL
ncbi:hypothetical protein LSAT2_008596 [Lamellibrachia satsuma]|nr:hypothetical protein LSAT2_008596 [Lamellibrachia satsuma]